MKKRNLILGGLLVAVAITSYSVSGTYAKYVSKKDSTDTARVAKWGLGKQNIDLFSESYLSTDNNTKNAVQSDCKRNGSGEPLKADGQVVDGYETMTQDDLLAACEINGKVVAPGTNGVYAFDLTGFKPETNYTISIVENATKGSSDTIGRINYYVKEMTSEAYKGLTDKTFAGVFSETLDADTTNETEANGYLMADGKITDIASKINAKLAGKVFEANTSNDKVYIIGWKWDFDDSTKTETDTDLGNGEKTYNGTTWADGRSEADKTNKVPTYGTVEFNVVVGAEQSDKAAN